MIKLRFATRKTIVTFEKGADWDKVNQPLQFAPCQMPYESDPARGSSVLLRKTISTEEQPGSA